ncbi:MAG: hypothetical protein C4334_03075 [Pyrinomonas sp.]|uniref:HD domain-containing phosphohydrolase n=1 Tax=Pyrinomonas sp. TaxID=2080306 RepID=UPI0033306E7D
MDRTNRLLHSFAALADLGQELSETRDFEELARASLYIILGTLAIRRGALGIYDPETKRLRFVATRGIQLKLSEEELDATVHDALVAAASTGLWLSSEAVPPVRAAFGSPFELLMPLVVRRELIGLLLVGEKANQEPINQDDREIIAAMVRHVAVGIHNHHLMAEVKERAMENRRLYDDLRALYHDTVRAFAVAIDCKDAYTRGHSERVGFYAAAVARALGLSEDEIEGIRVAGYLHDIGKLIVDREVMNSKLRFSACDVPELRQHTIAGYEILARIRHPYADLPLLARYHHERLDGSGYPEGLCAHEIPLGAKIIALADAFDAMTTTRPYRPQLSFEEVLGELARGTGTQFDPGVVRAFAQVLLREAEEVQSSTERHPLFGLLDPSYVRLERNLPLIEGLLARAERALAAAG